METGVGTKLFFAFFKCAALVDPVACPNQPQAGSWLEVIQDDGIEINLQLCDQNGQKLPKGPHNNLVIELFLKSGDTHMQLLGHIVLDDAGQAHKKLPQIGLINHSLHSQAGWWFQVIAREASNTGLEATLSKNIQFVPRGSTLPSTEIKVSSAPVCCSACHLRIHRVGCDGFDDMLPGGRIIIKTEKLFGLHLGINLPHDDLLNINAANIQLHAQAQSLLATNNAWEDLPASAFQPVEIPCLPFLLGGRRLGRGQNWSGRELRFVMSIYLPGAESPHVELIGKLAAGVISVNSKPGRPTTFHGRNSLEQAISMFPEECLADISSSSSSPSTSGEETLEDLKNQLYSMVPVDKEEEAKEVIHKMLGKLRAEFSAQWLADLL